jgi:HAE1 family hydrophobic/amphiphilic exporter-1
MRRLAELAVRFRVTFFMLYLGVIGGGVYFATQLRLDMYPDITFPLISVITSYSGASPTDIEELVTRPIEEACAAVEGVKHVNSESRDSASVLFIEFEWGTDLEQAQNDIRRNIDFVREYLPADATSPLIFAFDPSMQPVIIFNVSGPFDQASLREISKHEIEPRLERVPGVAAADTMGGLEREILVEVLPDRLAAMGIPVSQIIGTLRMENAKVPGGTVVHGDRELGIVTRGEFATVEEIRETVVGVAGGVPVRLRDVAAVRDTVAEQTRIVRADERSSVMLIVRKQSDANSVQVTSGVEAALPDLLQKLPAGMKLSKVFSQGDFITDSLSNLGTTGLLAIVMAVLVLLVFLRSLKASLIVGMAIPCSVVVAFAVMYAAGVTLNIISMAGLALAVGMLVDNSIVVLESIYRHLEQGKEKGRAAIDGASEVATAIFGSTLTTVAVFLPVLFVSGIAGAMFRDMALTICISLAASFLVAITLIPLAASVFIRSVKSRKEGLLVRGFGRLQAGSIASRPRRVLVFALAWAALAGSGFLISLVGVEFFPEEDQGMIMIQAKAQLGSTVEHLDRLVRPVERAIREEVPELELLGVDLGADEGFSSMFSEGRHTGIMRLRLIPLGQRDRRQKEIQDQLREILARFPGLDAKPFQPFNPMGAADVTVKIIGHDLETARRLGKDAKRIIEGLEGAKDVSFGLDENRPEYRVAYDRQRISRLGLTAADVSSTISSFFQGTIATFFREAGEEYNIRVRTPRDFREDPRNLGELLVRSPVAGPVPLRSIATVEEHTGPVKVSRQDQQRVNSIDANTGDKDLAAFIRRVDEALAAVPWPEGFRYEIGGAAEDFQESFQSLGIAIMIAILLVYMVMASIFESLRTPFVIVFTVPLGMTGVGIALFLTGTVMSVIALIGVVILVGVVVNNSIVLVDNANQHCARGLGRLEAVVTAARIRLRPILMTTLTTTLAMVPLAMELGAGAESWSPLARVVIGGLLTAMLITLFVVPVIYVWLGGGGAACAERISRIDEIPPQRS